MNHLTAHCWTSSLWWPPTALPIVVSLRLFALFPHSNSRNPPDWELLRPLSRQGATQRESFAFRLLMRYNAILINHTANKRYRMDGWWWRCCFLLLVVLWFRLFIPCSSTFHALDSSPTQQGCLLIKGRRGPWRRWRWWWWLCALLVGETLMLWVRTSSDKSANEEQAIAFKDRRQTLCFVWVIEGNFSSFFF